MAAQQNKMKCVNLWPLSTSVYDNIQVDFLFLNYLKKAVAGTSTT